MQTTFDELVQQAAESTAAAEALFAMLYDELHRLAEQTLRRNGHALSLGTTTLLHETYLKVAGRDGLAFDDRARFFAYAARAMRSLVVDYARQRRALKRGGQLQVTFDDNVPAGMAAGDSDELVRIGDAMAELTAVDASLAELVDLHFFGGFTLGEIAAFRNVSERTVQRDWRKARLLLRNAVPDSPG